MKKKRTLKQRAKHYAERVDLSFRRFTTIWVCTASYLAGWRAAVREHGIRRDECLEYYDKGYEHGVEGTHQGRALEELRAKCCHELQANERLKKELALLRITLDAQVKYSEKLAKDLAKARPAVPIGDWA